MLMQHERQKKAGKFSVVQYDSNICESEVLQYSASFGTKWDALFEMPNLRNVLFWIKKPSVETSSFINWKFEALWPYGILWHLLGFMPMSPFQKSPCGFSQLYGEENAAAKSTSHTIDFDHLMKRLGSSWRKPSRSNKWRWRSGFYFEKCNLWGSSSEEARTGFFFHDGRGWLWLA